MISIFQRLQQWLFKFINWRAKPCFNIFCNVFINIYFYVYNETIFIYITQFCFYSIFLFHIAIPELTITIHYNFIQLYNMIIWFWNQLDSSFSVVISLLSLCFLTFSIVLPKTELLISLKKSFSKSLFAFFLSLVFISIHGFGQTFWLNLATLCTFPNTSPWLIACFNFLCE